MSLSYRKTSRMICSANQLTSFYIRATLLVKGLKFLCDVELKMPLFYFLVFLVIIWNENSISIPIHYGVIYFWIWMLDGAAYQGGKEAEVGRRTLMSNLSLISNSWYDVEKLTVPGSSNLAKFKIFRGTAEGFVLKRWQKKGLLFVLLH